MRAPNRIEMEDFKRILNEQIDLHNQVERLMDEKRYAIIKGQLNKLAETDDQLEKLTQRIKDVEQERIELMVQMGRQNDTLKTFLATLESGEDTQFMEASREQLVKTTSSIKRLSQTNRDLLTQSIGLIEQSVDFIAGLLAPKGAAYHNNPNGTLRSSEHSMEASYGMPSTIDREA